jgi:uncharacterized NAD(P)/FAD-binding protein YdhS
MINDGRPRRIDHVAIIGAGFSGSLQAINLVRHGGPRATLIERRGTLGRGVAYSAAHPDHLLNVRAANMSALPDDPLHFVRWLAEHRPDIQGFAPRLIYGEYLDGLLAQARADAGGRVDVRTGAAVDVRFEGDAVHVVLDDGEVITADAVILALGNLPPHEPRGLPDALVGSDIYAADPWAAGVADGLASDDNVLVVGTGLTMVDVALLLDARGFQGRIVALSRRGLVARAHGDAGAAQSPISERPAPVATSLLRAVRSRSRAVGWRAAVDELRPFTQSMWLAAGIEERRRFLRHLRPWWDVHRHRLAPEVAARVAAMRERGQLEIVAGKLFDVTRDGDRATVRWHPRGTDAVRSETVRRIVNCSGPQGDLLRTDEPLLRRLLTSGAIRPDALRIGIDVNAQSEVLGADGTANPRLIALGPLTRGSFWEIVAVPDIRVQTWSVARRLANAQWVGGEGL